jgi:hypothetical protein
MYVCMYLFMNVFMDGWMDGWMVGGMNGGWEGAEALIPGPSAPPARAHRRGAWQRAAHVSAATCALPSPPAS